MTQKKLPSRMHVAFVGLLALAFIGMGVFSLPETFAVLRSRSVTTARVVESREMPTRYGVSYDVRYVFSPGAGKPEIGRSDFTGRTSLWASLPQDCWRAAIESGQLQVRFDPDTPTNNAPVDCLPSIWDCITPLALGGVLVLIVIGVERMRLKQTHS